MSVLGEMYLRKNKLIGIAIGILVGILSYFFGALETAKLIIALIILKIAIKKPIYALILYILSIPFVSDMNSLLMGIVVIVSYRIDFIREGKLKFRFTPANFLLILFTITVVINTFLSVTPSGSFRDFAIHIIAIGIVFMMIHSKNTKKEVYWLSVTLVLTATIVSIYGIYQYFQGVPMESGWVDITQNPDIKTRVYATFENPNLLAEYLIMIFPISITLLFYNKNIIQKICFASISFIILICIGLTLSRGSWVGLAFGMILFVLLVDFKKLVFFIPAGLGAIFLMPTMILQRIATIGSLQDSSNFYRYNLWNMAVDILKDYWFSGIGVGYLAFRKISPLYIRTMSPYHTHNTYLQIAIELGIVGIIVFLLLIINIFRMGVSAIVNGKNRFTKYFTTSYMVSLSAVLVHGMVEHVLYNPKIMLMFWLIVGMNICAYNIYIDEKSIKEI